MEIVWFLIGVFFGLFLCGLAIILKSNSGVLRIDHSNPEKDVYRFEIDKIEKLSKKHVIMLKVDNKANLSHN